jgi:tetratricopeptide (TPR) repeat protein
MQKILCILLLKMLFFGQLFGQQPPLIRQLKLARTDSTRLRIFNELGMLFKTRRHANNTADLDTAKSWFLKALPLSHLVPDSSKYSRNHIQMNLGEIAFGKQNIPECISYFRQSIALSQRKHQPLIEAESWERLGSRLNYPTNSELHVVDYYAKAIAIYAKLNDQNNLIRLNFLSAVNLRYMDKTSEAVKICHELIAKYKKTKFKNLERVYLLMSVINRYDGNLNKALYYSLGGVRRMDLIADTTNAEELYGELAQVYQATGDMRNSIYYYKKTILIREQINAPQQFIFRTAGFVIQMLITQKKAAEGLKYITELEKRHSPDSEFQAAIVAQIKADCYDALGATALAEKTIRL